MTAAKFELDAQGNLVLPDFTELKSKLAENLKAGIFSSLPDEFFDAQVQKAFEALTKERDNLPASGDFRCDPCRGKGYGTHARLKCPHNLSRGPSEIQEMIQDQMREHVKDRINAFSKRWAEKGITDAVIVGKMEKLVEAAGRAFVAQAGQMAVKNQLEALSAQIGGLGSSLDQLHTCNACGSRGKIPGVSCHQCGVV